VATAKAKKSQASGEGEERTLDVIRAEHERVLDGIRKLDEELASIRYDVAVAQNESALAYQEAVARGQEPSDEPDARVEELQAKGTRLERRLRTLRKKEVELRFESVQAEIASLDGPLKDLYDEHMRLEGEAREARQRAEEAGVAHRTMMYRQQDLKQALRDIRREQGLPPKEPATAPLSNNPYGVEGEWVAVGRRDR
jgi:chromosome segregation ATPase